MHTASDGHEVGPGPSLPAVIDPIRVEREERYVRNRFWTKLRANLHRVPFLADALAAYYCATDPATPPRAKAILLGALVYFILPFDVVPDWMVVVGFADDAAVLAAAIQVVRANLTPAHKERARAALEAERQRAEASL